MASFSSSDEDQVISLSVSLWMFSLEVMSPATAVIIRGSMSSLCSVTLCFNFLLNGELNDGHLHVRCKI